MLIREATAADSKDIFNWRNDTFSIAMAKNSTKVDFSDHERWFKNSLNDINCKIYIGILAELKIGVCRFNYEKTMGAAEISINLNPLMRGQGLSLSFLTKSIETYKKNEKSPLIATIRKENEASFKLFTRSSFLVTHEDDHFFFMKKTK